MDKVSTPKTLDEHLFDELKADAFNVILLDHFPGFQESPEAKLLQAEVSKKEVRTREYASSSIMHGSNKKALIEGALPFSLRVSYGLRLFLVD